jgi:hypothetical protein
MAETTRNTRPAPKAEAPLPAQDAPRKEVQLPSDRLDGLWEVPLPSEARVGPTGQPRSEFF